MMIWRLNVTRVTTEHSTFATQKQHRFKYLIAPLHVPDVQVPLSVPLVRDPDPGVPGDHMVAHGQDGGAVVVDPGHLTRGEAVVCSILIMLLYT